MNGLIRLWKTNAVIVAAQIPVGIGLWLFTRNSPKLHTPIEALGGALFLLALLTVLFGLLSIYVTLMRNPPVFEPPFVSLASGILLGVGVGAGCVWMNITDGPSFSFKWYFLFVRFSVLWIYGFIGLVLLVMSMFHARESDAVKAPWWVYALTALPLGIGVVGGGSSLLLRKLLS